MYEMSISLSTTVLCWSSIRVLYGKKRFIVRQLQKKKKKKNGNGTLHMSLGLRTM